MPFKKRSDGKYVSQSGRVMSLEQVQAYYASKNDKKKRYRRKRG